MFVSSFIKKTSPYRMNDHLYENIIKVGFLKSNCIDLTKIPITQSNEIDDTIDKNSIYSGGSLEHIYDTIGDTYLSESDTEVGDVYQEQELLKDIEPTRDSSSISQRKKFFNQISKILPKINLSKSKQTKNSDIDEDSFISEPITDSQKSTFNLGFQIAQHFIKKGIKMDNSDLEKQSKLFIDETNNYLDSKNKNQEIYTSAADLSSDNLKELEIEPEIHSSTTTPDKKDIQIKDQLPPIPSTPTTEESTMTQTILNSLSNLCPQIPSHPKDKKVNSSTLEQEFSSVMIKSSTENKKPIDNDVEPEDAWSELTDYAQFEPLQSEVLVPISKDQQRSKTKSLTFSNSNFKSQSKKAFPSKSKKIQISTPTEPMRIIPGGENMPLKQYNELLKVRNIHDVHEFTPESTSLSYITKEEAISFISMEVSKHFYIFKEEIKNLKKEIKTLRSIITSNSNNHIEDKSTSNQPIFEEKPKFIKRGGVTLIGTGKTNYESKKPHSKQQSDTDEIEAFFENLSKTKIREKVVISETQYNTESVEMVDDTESPSSDLGAVATAVIMKDLESVNESPYFTNIVFLMISAAIEMNLKKKDDYINNVEEIIKYIKHELLNKFNIKIELQDKSDLIQLSNYLYETRKKMEKDETKNIRK